MATPDNKYGIDRWTSNGYGIKLGPLTAEDKKAAAEVNAELSAARKKANQRKPTVKKK